MALAENELGGNGVAALSVVLASCGELKRLDLSRNNVGETGALALVSLALVCMCVCVRERERERERESERASES